jgi:hypothetical protein
VLECRADLRWANVLWREQVVANLTLPEQGDELVVALDPLPPVAAGNMPNGYCRAWQCRKVSGSSMTFDMPLFSGSWGEARGVI